MDTERQSKVKSIFRYQIHIHKLNYPHTYPHAHNNEYTHAHNNEYKHAHVHYISYLLTKTLSWCPMARQ